MAHSATINGGLRHAQQGAPLVRSHKNMPDSDSVGEQQSSSSFPSGAGTGRRHRLRAKERRLLAQQQRGR